MWRMDLIEMDDTSMKDYNRSNSKWDIIRKLTTQVFPRVLLNLSLAIIQDTVQRKKKVKRSVDQNLSLLNWKRIHFLHPFLSKYSSSNSVRYKKIRASAAKRVLCQIAELLRSFLRRRCGYVTCAFPKFGGNGLLF